MSSTLLTTAQSFIVDRVTVDANGCWIWAKHIDKVTGYGSTNHNGETKPHRVAFRAWKGEIPAGLEIDHTCKVRSCSNPDHLILATHQDNCRRRASATMCRNGHPRITPPADCRECNRERQERWRNRQAARRSP